MSIWTKAFWRAAAERAFKTLAQTEAALLTADGTGLLNSDWQTSLSVSGMAAIISLLTSVGSGLGDGGPSLGGVETVSADVAAKVGDDGLVAGPAASVTDGEPVTVEARPYQEPNRDGGA